MSQRKLVVILLTLFFVTSVTAQTKIVDNNIPGDASALLELQSTDKGFLLTRVQLVATNSPAPLIAPVAAGMEVYNTFTSAAGPNAVTPGVYYYNGLVWVREGGNSNDWLLSGNANTIPGTGAGQNYLGTTDNKRLVFGVAASEKMTILPNGHIGVNTANPDANLQVYSNTPADIAVTGVAPSFRLYAGQTYPGDNNGSPTGGLCLASVKKDFVNTSLPGDVILGSFSTVGSLVFVSGGTQNERMRILPTGDVGINITTPTSTLQVAGSVATAITTIKANVALDATYSSVIVNSTSIVPITITLPQASGCAGRIYRILNKNGRPVNIRPFAGDAINGATGITQLNGVYQGKTLQSDGTTWYVMQ